MKQDMVIKQDSKQGMQLTKALKKQQDHRIGLLLLTIASALEDLMGSFSECHSCILMIGLDAAGKTTFKSLLYTLKLNDTISIISTFHSLQVYGFASTFTEF